MSYNRQRDRQFHIGSGPCPGVTWRHPLLWPVIAGADIRCAWLATNTLLTPPIGGQSSVAQGLPTRHEFLVLYVFALPRALVIQIRTCYQFLTSHEMDRGKGECIETEPRPRDEMQTGTCHMRMGWFN